jgi:pimeloyl-ACP methyl ester carboxylesterase
VWGDAALVTPERPLLVMMHGWMDVGASFQFVVDELARREGPIRCIVAADWRGFGGSESGGADSFWFPDYLGDLDALLDALAPDAPVDLVGHSMGGNIAMQYAGVRPGRIRRLVNLEGFGMPATRPEQAPKRLATWLDELKEPATLRTYATVDEVAERLLKNNPLLTPDKAAWLAPHWSRLSTGPGADGRWHIQGHPAHKRINPVLYQVPEVLEAWKLITAPLLWVDGDLTDITKWWGHRFPRSEFDERLAVVRQVQRVRLAPCGHMLHHDQPQALARHLQAFLA